MSDFWEAFVDSDEGGIVQKFLAERGMRRELLEALVADGLEMVKRADAVASEFRDLAPEDRAYVLMEASFVAGLSMAAYLDHEAKKATDA